MNNLLQIVLGDLTPSRPVKYQTLTWRRPLWPRSKTMRALTVEGAAADLSGIANGTYLMVREDRLGWGTDVPIYRVEHVDYDSGDGVETVKVEAAPLTAYIGRTVVTPLGATVDFGSGAAQDTITAPAETAIKYYWDSYAGPSAPAARQWADLTIEADQARGSSVTVAARGQTLTEVCEWVGIETGTGWEVVYRLAERDLMLQTTHGVSRPKVMFSIERRTAQRFQLMQNDRPPNVAVVLGDGDGATRPMEVVWLGATEPTPPDRREVVIEASDVSTAAEMRTRGLAELRAGDEDFQNTDRVRVEVDALLRKQPYRTKWDRGDIVLARSLSRSYSQWLRVVDVECTDGRDGLTARAEIGMPWPSIDALTDDTARDHR